MCWSGPKSVWCVAKMIIHTQSLTCSLRRRPDARCTHTSPFSLARLYPGINKELISGPWLRKTLNLAGTATNSNTRRTPGSLSLAAGPQCATAMQTSRPIKRKRLTALFRFMASVIYCNCRLTACNGQLADDSQLPRREMLRRENMDPFQQPPRVFSSRLFYWPLNLGIHFCLCQLLADFKHISLKGRIMAFNKV